MSRLARLIPRRTISTRGQNPHGKDGFFFPDIRPEDTYLVSFPRSGNTYLRHLVASLVLERAPTPAELQELVPDVHRATVGQPTRSGAMVAKSHSPAATVPARVVYLVRDGRAALLSYHHYLEQRGRPTPSSADAMLSWRDVWPCRWQDHVSGWLRKLEGRENAVLLRYEDLIEDPVSALRQVAVLADVAFREEALEEAVRSSSRDSMRRTERKDSSGSLNFVGTASPSWREAFGYRALSRFEHECGDVLSRLRYPLVASGRD